MLRAVFPFVAGTVSLTAFNSKILPDPGGVLLQDVVILPERIALPFVGQQNALQIRMAGENNSEHVKHFALQPVCRRPDFHRARHFFSVGRPHLQPQPLVLRERIKIEHHVDAISASWPRSTVRIACLRSSIASKRAAPNLPRIRVTSSLLSGVCSDTGGFGAAGTAGFGGAPGAATPAGLAGGTDAEDGLPPGLSPVGTEGGCCSLGSSAMDPGCYWLRSASLRSRWKDGRSPVATIEGPGNENSNAAFLTHGVKLVNLNSLRTRGCRIGRRKEVRLTPIQERPSCTATRTPRAKSPETRPSKPARKAPGAPPPNPCTESPRE